MVRPRRRSSSKLLVELPRALDHLAVLVGPLALDRVDDRGLLLGVGQADTKHLTVPTLSAQSGHEPCRGAGGLRGRREQAHGLLQVVTPQAAEIAPRVDAECRGAAGRGGDGDQQPVAGHGATMIPHFPTVFQSRRTPRFMPSATLGSARADWTSTSAVLPSRRIMRFIPTVTRVSLPSDSARCAKYLTCQVLTVRMDSPGLTWVAGSDAGVPARVDRPCARPLERRTSMTESESRRGQPGWRQRGQCSSRIGALAALGGVLALLATRTTVRHDIT